MKAVIRSLTTSDGIDLRNVTVADPSDFELYVRIIAGPDNGPGEESFDFTLLTPVALARRLRDVGMVVGRFLIFVDHFDALPVREMLERLVTSCEGPDWPAVGNQLAAIACWEFQGY